MGHLWLWRETPAQPPPTRLRGPLRTKLPQLTHSVLQTGELGPRGNGDWPKGTGWELPPSAPHVSQVPAWALPRRPARGKATYPEGCSGPADQLPRLLLKLSELCVAVAAPAASSRRAALLCARPGALGRGAAAEWVLLGPGRQPLAGGHLQQLRRLRSRAALRHLRGRGRKGTVSPGLWAAPARDPAPTTPDLGASRPQSDALSTKLGARTRTCRLHSPSIPGGPREGPPQQDARRPPHPFQAQSSGGATLPESILGVPSSVPGRP